jgi:hypothetical protein
MLPLAALLLAACTKPQPVVPAAPPPQQQPAPATPAPPPAPPPVAPPLPDLRAPLGLQWGPADEKTVQATIQKRFPFANRKVFEKEDAVELRFGAGWFGGVAVDGLVAEIACGRFMLLQPRLPLKDKRPLYRRWKSLVDVIASEYGKPTEQVEPPSAAAAANSELPSPEDSALLTMSLRAADREAQDAVSEDILRGRGDLIARWDFAAGRFIAVFAKASKPNHDGQQSIDLNWYIMDLGPETKACHAKAPAQPKDF